jgi:hypothetical protein
MNWADERTQKLMLNDVFTWASDLAPNLAPSGFAPFLAHSFAPVLALIFASYLAPSFALDFAPSVVPKL